MRAFFVFLFVNFSLLFCSITRADQVNLDDLNTWIGTETAKSIEMLLKNISPTKSERGAVIASPSRVNPDYYYHWIRDAALVMNTVISLFENAQTAEEKSQWIRIMGDYIDFSRRNQLTPNRSGDLGEPKFHANGRAFNGDWGRPQNDGPALRALTLTRFARRLMAIAEDSGDSDWIRHTLVKLYDGRLPTHSVIKADLEFVSHHWRDPSFDLWEEVLGDHFYTRIVQYRSLIEGSKLARDLGDIYAAEWYKIQASYLRTEIVKHWNPEKGYIVATLGQDNSDHMKASGLDVAVILGALHAASPGSGSPSPGKEDPDAGFFAPASDLVLSTAVHLREAFQDLYEINRVSGLGVAIGRYPEDRYDGYVNGPNPGNPWVLATHAFAELYFQVAKHYLKQGKILINSRNIGFFSALGSPAIMRLAKNQTLYEGTWEFDKVIELLNREGDDYLLRVKYHTNPDGSLSEQFNRLTGHMQGAPHLTWSYSSFLTAIWERSKVKDSEGVTYFPFFQLMNFFTLTSDE